jgi:hypothetical protein
LGSEVLEAVGMQMVADMVGDGAFHLGTKRLWY